MRHQFFSAISLMIAATLLLSAPALHAQGTCQEFRAISPLTFDFSAGTYVGPIYAILDREVLVGKILTPVLPDTTCQGGVCHDTKARYEFDFGEGDSFTVEIQFAVYNEPPGWGNYRAVEKIVAGSGRFQQASGVLVESGPFLAWVDSTTQLQSRYIGELSGRVCNVMAKRQ